MTFPPEPANGIIVSGLPATSLTTYPAELAEEIRTLLPGYIVYPDPGQAYSDSGADSFLAVLDQAINGRLALWRQLLQQETWDFAMVVFNATDVVQHAMWKHMSPEHPLYHPAKTARYQDAILNVYRRMDSILGEVMAGMDENTVLLVMSDHGFGPLHKFIHVNTWLMREKQLAIRRAPAARAKAALFRLGLSPMPLYDVLMRFGLGRLKREVVRGRGQGLLRAFFLSFDDVDWSRTTAYSYGNIGQIRINLKSREPQGIVEPRDYDTTVSDIIERLSRLRDPQTGETVIDSIYRRAEIYQGELTAQAPDILFLPKRLEYFGFGEYEFGDHRVIAALRRGISGTHRMNGIGLVWGAPIQPGQMENVRLEDWAPTILHLMGLPIPQHMDGRPLLEILRTEAGLPPPTAAPAWDYSQESTTELSEADEQIIRQRLKDLGYVS
jgi:predicted AlkP superfamily phosphohydrolase/phosphomutase